MPPHSDFDTACIEWRNPQSSANESSSSFEVLALPSSTTLPPLTDENDTWNEAKKTKQSVRFNDVVRCLEHCGATKASAPSSIAVIRKAYLEYCLMVSTKNMRDKLDKNNVGN